MRSIFFFVLALFFLRVSSPSFAQAPSSLSFQGFVTDSAGTPINSGSKLIGVKLYDGSSAIWSRNYTVEIVEGVFNVSIGGLFLDTLRFNRPLSLGIKVGTDPEISPRTQLAAAAYANALPGMYTFFRNEGNWAGYNVVGGWQDNVLGEGVVGATISGGGALLFDAVPSPNTVLASFGTIGGGVNNTAARFAATVGGGNGNSASGLLSTVPGGSANAARGDNSFAAGYHARARHHGSFVWSDRSIVTGNDSVLSTGQNQFLIRAAGGVGIGTNSPNSQLTVVGKADFDSVQIGSVSTNLKLDIAGGAWDLNATEGDLRIGTATNHLKIGVATDGGGAGRTAIRAQGTPVPELRLGAEDVDVVIINKGDGLIPVADNTYTLGKSGNRWTAVWATTGVVSSSDRRLKQNIAALEYGLETVLALEPVSYYWKSTPEDGRRLGLIAQDVESIVPEIVHHGDSDDDMMGLNYSELVPVLIRAIQEQDAENKAQQTQIDNLLTDAGEQTRRLAALEARLLP
ncbi:MAG: tail fiber domain-containing protein [Rhodothermia bacterium]